MRYLDLTLPTAAENLALDEALLEEAEAGGGPNETLRLWEPRQTMVVVGRSSRIAAEVRTDACRELGIPVLRRPSGGAAIVTGPGCLMYALVLSYRLRPELRALSRTHQWVLGTLAAALETHVPGVRCCGTSDLAIDGRKFSGNSTAAAAGICSTTAHCCTIFRCGWSGGVSTCRRGRRITGRAGHTRVSWRICHCRVGCCGRR